MTCIPRAELERWDELAPERRRAVVDHAGGCATCRDSWSAVDPARMFALLAACPVPAGDLEVLSRRVTAAIDAARPAPPVWLPWAAGAAIAAALALAGALGLLLGTAEMPAPVVTTAATSWPSTPVADPAADAPPAPAEVSVYSPAAADVINFKAGDTQVVFIFDEALEL